MCRSPGLQLYRPYIYIEREREREKEKKRDINKNMDSITIVVYTMQTLGEDSLLYALVLLSGKTVD